MNCYHCGDKIVGKPIVYDQKKFCCNGCSTVYQILSENGLNNFYELNEGSGIKPGGKSNQQFTPLDVPEIFNDFVDFQNEQIYIVTFFLPAIHCSSCIYLLENLNKLEPCIIKGEANFTARTLQLTIKKELPLSKVAAILDSIGYKPDLRPKSTHKNNTIYDKKLLLKLGLAGFAFGSVMLWTFPEYLGLDETFIPFRNLSSYLTLLVSLPVFFYSAWDYIRSAYTGIKTRQLNLDIPIAIGIIVLFGKSSISILLEQGPGYMDSFTGFVFFLLIGKWFQSKTYRNMAFDNDPKAYFPLGVHRVKNDQSEEIIVIDKLSEGDCVKLFNEEVIPCDIELTSDSAVIDTSFLTGEADLIHVSKGQRIYAGSKLIGSSIIGTVLRTTDRSKFAGIWNSSSKEKPQSLALNRENKLSKYFLIIVFTIALIGGITWFFIDADKVIEIVTAVLVVACPCALALSFPFVYGNALRKFGKEGLYFKNSFEIEKLNSITHIVFDKTGTLTKDKTEGIQFSGQLSSYQIDAAYSLTTQSTHPYSVSISEWLRHSVSEGVEIIDFKELPGLGVEAKTKTGDIIKIGNAQFVKTTETDDSGSFLSWNGELIGKFTFQSQLRDDIIPTLKRLKSTYSITLLSGDKSSDASLFDEIDDFDMHFNQSPSDKKRYIENLEQNGSKVAFLGDGLNDSEALNSATLGISVADDVFRFTPSCDAIISGDKVQALDYFFKFGKYTSRGLLICMLFSLLYNTIGMTFALLGYVTPLFAAILMPLSSISIVFLSTGIIFFKKMK